MIQLSARQSLNLLLGPFLCFWLICDLFCERNVVTYNGGFATQHDPTQPDALDCC